MPTLSEYRAEMLTVGPEDLGEVLAIASLDAQGVTVTEKATGVVDASEYIGKRSEERRVGKECLRLCRSRWSPYH